MELQRRRDHKRGVGSSKVLDLVYIYIFYFFFLNKIHFAQFDADRESFLFFVLFSFFLPSASSSSSSSSSLRLQKMMFNFIVIVHSLISCFGLM